MGSGSFKYVIYKNVLTNHILNIYVYKEDLALDNLQWFNMPYNPTKPNHIYIYI